MEQSSGSKFSIGDLQNSEEKSGSPVEQECKDELEELLGKVSSVKKEFLEPLPPKKKALSTQKPSVQKFDPSCINPMDL